MDIKYEVTTNLNKETVIIRHNLDGTTSSFMANLDNADYQEYLAVNEAKAK